MPKNEKFQRAIFKTANFPKTAVQKLGLTGVAKRLQLFVAIEEPSASLFDEQPSLGKSLPVSVLEQPSSSKPER